MKCWTCSIFSSQQIASCLHNWSVGLIKPAHVKCSSSNRWTLEQAVEQGQKHIFKKNNNNFLSSLKASQLHTDAGCWLAGQATNPRVVLNTPVFWLLSVWLWPQESKHTDMSSYKKELWSLLPTTTAAWRINITRGKLCRRVFALSCHPPAASDKKAQGCKWQCWEQQGREMMWQCPRCAKHCKNICQGWYENNTWTLGSVPKTETGMSLRKVSSSDRAVTLWSGNEWKKLEVHTW